jgi:hypothetical protein
MGCGESTFVYEAAMPVGPVVVDDPVTPEQRAECIALCNSRVKAVVKRFELNLQWELLQRVERAADKLMGGQGHGAWSFHWGDSDDFPGMCIACAAHKRATCHHSQTQFVWADAGPTVQELKDALDRAFKPFKNMLLALAPRLRNGTIVTWDVAPPIVTVFGCVGIQVMLIIAWDATATKPGFTWRRLHDDEVAPASAPLGETCPSDPV